MSDECICGETSARNCPVHQGGATDLTEKLSEIRARLGETEVRVVERFDKITGTVAYIFPDYEADLELLLKVCEIQSEALERIESYVGDYAQVIAEETQEAVDALLKGSEG